MLKGLGVSLLLVALGAVLCYFGVYEPYMAMSRGESGVSYSDKLMLFGPFIVVVGVIFLLATPFVGPKGVMSPWAQQTGAGKVVMVLALLLGLAAGGYVAWEWFPTQAAAFGYARS
jgi:hypothetical protein